MAAFQGCASQNNCAATVQCADSTCAAEGLSQSCMDLCCMTCQMLGTCNLANAALTCVAQQCAGVCMAPSC
jgi:hypothetical protein